MNVPYVTGNVPKLSKIIFFLEIVPERHASRSKWVKAKPRIANQQDHLSMCLHNLLNINQKRKDFKSKYELVVEV